MRTRSTITLLALAFGVAIAAQAGAEVPVARTVTAVQWSAAAECRMAFKQLGPPDVCSYVDGRFIGEAQIKSYERSWVHRALMLQRQLDAGAPLIDELFAHTHNSFNSSAYDTSLAQPPTPTHPGYYPTLTNQDPNQVYSLTDQLRMDVRAIELDLHWFPSPFGSAQTDGNWVILCHGQTQQLGPQAVQIGCSDDRPVQDGFAEVAAWLKANPHEFVVLYLENQLQASAQAHAIAGALLKQYFGSLIMPTSKGKPCASMPYESSRAALMAKGYRLLVVGNCDVGGPTAWGALVHERGPKWDEGGDPSTYSIADCAKDSAHNLAHTIFRREYEDQTFVTAVTGTNPTTDAKRPVSRDNAALMARCGVNLVGFDQLRPDDGRLSGLVWSWAVDEPNGHGCAYQGADTRFHIAACATPKAFACLSPQGTWKVAALPDSWDQGRVACAKVGRGYVFATPVNGLRNALLADAKGHLADVWLSTKA